MWSGFACAVSFIAVEVLMVLFECGSISDSFLSKVVPRRFHFGRCPLMIAVLTIYFILIELQMNAPPTVTLIISSLVAVLVRKVNLTTLEYSIVALLTKLSNGCASTGLASINSGNTNAG